MDHLALWVAAFLTLGIYSFLYKDNPWYKLCEAIFVGISAGYWFVTLFWDNIYGKFWVGKGEDYMLYVGAALGLLMLMRLIPKIGWISRWPLSFVVGATAGFYLINYFLHFHDSILRAFEGSLCHIPCVLRGADYKIPHLSFF